MSYPELTEFARTMRQKILDISYHSGTSTHIGGALSMTDVMAVLYGKVLNFDAQDPRWPERDRFILSKGHGVLGFYPALLGAGIISQEVFDTFQQNGSDLIAHPVMNLDLGIESSNGSLGHGISMAVGIAFAAKKQAKPFHTYTLVGDGETNEGSVWEAAMLASHLKLDNLTAIIDYNKQQNDGFGKDVLHIDNMAERFRAFGWHVIEVDGHDIDAIVEAFEEAPLNKPKAIVANTIKGKGVSFMEGDNAWHHNRLTKTNYEAAVAALNKSNNERSDNGNNV
ncbi:transketolase [Pseudoalteromonas sp. BMB]|uniref:transketolase n=1 Tax=Pseudoalteromonas sp. BMB TaxID=1874619 RepID=UPI00083DAD3C|nr:transketolase [Pseudoalteromonas sp. BMB]ODB43106.1 transketolase [Pseudoalteromonas sp. BMB]